MGLISVERVCHRHLRGNEEPRENATPRCLMKRLVALVSEKRTNHLIGQITLKPKFRQFCLIFALTYRTRFSSNKIFLLKNVSQQIYSILQFYFFHYLSIVLHFLQTIG